MVASSALFGDGVWSALFLLEGLWVDFFFFKQKTAYEMRISDWSSDVCSSDLPEWHHDGDRCGGCFRSGYTLPAVQPGSGERLVLGRGEGFRRHPGIQQTARCSLAE